MFSDIELSQMTQRELFNKYHYMIEETDPLPSEKETWRLINEYFDMEVKRQKLAKRRRSHRSRKKGFRNR